MTVRMVRQRATVGIARGFRTPLGEPLQPNPSAALWSPTKRQPWDVKADNRAASKRARISRRANRPA